MNRARRLALRILTLPAGGSALLAADSGSLWAQATKPLERTGGPYVPTPWPVVDQMIRAAAIVASDLVMDLGSGDGRLVIAAAQRHGSRGFGVDIDPELVRLANQNAEKEGVGKRVRFEQRDIFDTDVREATVLTLYLLPGMMLKLRPRLLADLRPGTRIVAHDYHFGEWRADSQLTFDVPEKLAITGVPNATVYHWTVPARMAGRWRVSAPAASGLDGASLDLRQTFQDFDGSVTVSGQSAQRVDATSLRGGQFRFASVVEGRGGKPGRAVFRGQVDGARMDGTIELPAGSPVKFGATYLGAAAAPASAAVSK